ncbi:MAG: hypothetical protein JO317_02070 [Verrucomicrobiae bacterium]|nr:hypothetical protein [Verrucomicrobiae bacterium]
MKKILLFLLILIPLVASATLYGTLESCANLVEGLLLPFTTDKTSAGALLIGGPFLLAIITMMLAVLISVPLVASVLAACLGGWGLRQAGSALSRRSARLSIVLAALATAAFVCVASSFGALVPVSRPAQKPKTPAPVLACFAGLNAALSVFVATRILRRMTRASEEPHLNTLE